MKVLLEEVAACRRRPQEGGQGERFPSLLLSSLDKLFEDKQQQLWLVSVGVNNPDERDYGRFRILNVGREIYLSGDGGCGLLLGEHF